MSQGSKSRRAGHPLRRPLILAGALALLIGLAFLVARPSVPDPATNPYAGKRGGSLAKSAGLEILFQRGDEVRPVDPQTILKAGDELVFKVRGEGPSYLEVRLRDGLSEPRTIFPVGAAMTQKVMPSEWLRRVRVEPGGGKLVVTALFSDQSRPIGAPPDTDARTVTAVISKE